jgi:hypothetical protein
MSVSEDYKNLTGMIKDMESSIKTLSIMADATIQGLYDLPDGVKTTVANMTDDEVSTLTEEKFTSLLNDNKCSIDDFKKTWKDVNPDKPDEAMMETVISMFKSYKSSLKEIEGFEKQKNQIKSELKQATDNWFEYVNSAEYKSKKLQRLQELEERVESEKNPTEKRKIQKMIKTMRDAETLDFLFERLEKSPQKESANIKDIYLNDNKRSQMIINKFKSRLPKYGYNPVMYKMFFNIEEKFLPEEYHDFNNLFLFCVMRYISFSDPYDKYDSMLVSSLLMKLYNLLYHKFETNDNEEEFVNIVKRMLDYFKPYEEEFKEKNITSPKHPRRIARQAEQEAKERCVLINRLIDLGVDPDTDMSTQELRDKLEAALNKDKSVETDDNSTSTDSNPVHTIEKVISADTGVKVNVHELQVVSPTTAETSVPKTYHSENIEDVEAEIIDENEQVTDAITSVKKNIQEKVKRAEPAPAVVKPSVVSEPTTVTGDGLMTMDVDDFFSNEAVEEDVVVHQPKIYIPPTEPQKPEVPKDKYYDKYDYFYMKLDNGKYGYFNGTYPDEPRYDDNEYSEEDILRLMATDSLRKNEKFPK